MMDLANPEERPRKKPRFFVENPPSPKEAPEPHVSAAKDVSVSATDSISNQSTTLTEIVAKSEDSFDVDLLTAVVDEQLPDSTIKQLRDRSGGNLERGMSSGISVKSKSDKY
jgi:riboflavin synthase alpha subunit